MVICPGHGCKIEGNIQDVKSDLYSEVAHKHFLFLVSAYGGYRVYSRVQYWHV
jgi:hypothetical protein